MGFGIRIAPGVRISASSRGIRAGVGPRAARIHVGAGRTGFSTGAGPLTYYTSASGGRRRRSGSSGGYSQAAVAAHERQLRQASRAEEIAKVSDFERNIVSAHLEDFPPAERGSVPPEQPVDENALRKEFEARELAGISIFKRAERKAAKERAELALGEALKAERTRHQETRRVLEEELDVAWNELLRNVPERVLGALESAFEDNEIPAAAVDCRGDVATIVLLAIPQSVIPEKKAAMTPSGAPTLKKRTKTEAAELYVSIVASHSLATIKETFAVAPGLGSVVLLVIRREPSAGLGADRLTTLFCGTIARELIEPADWQRIDLVRVLDEVPGALMRRSGRAGELQPLDLSDEPELAAVVEQIEAGLGQKAEG
jgi:hypothetical protein